MIDKNCTSNTTQAIPTITTTSMITNIKQLKEAFNNGLENYVRQENIIEEYSSPVEGISFPKSAVIEMYKTVIKDLLSKFPEVVDKVIRKHQSLDFLILKEEKEKYIQNEIKQAGLYYMRKTNYDSEWFSIDNFQNEIFEEKNITRITHLYLEEKHKDDNYTRELPRCYDGIMGFWSLIFSIVEIKFLKLEFEKLADNTNSPNTNDQVFPIQVIFKHSNIFKNNAFEVWESMYESFDIKESSRSDVKFMFEVMKKDGLIFETVNQKSLLEWIDQTYGIIIQKTSNISKTTERNSIYSNAKQLYTA
jgi:hypothetical protein